MNSTNQVNVLRSAQNVLSPKRQAFATMQHELAERLKEENVTQELIEQVMNSAVDLIEGLEVANGTAKHLHGDRYDVYNQQQIRPEGDFIHQQVVSPRQITHNNTEVNIATDRIYRVTADLIVSTNGQFVFRPVSQKLYAAGQTIDLSALECSRLLSFLHTDFNC